jgi:hypothetical protein
MNETEWAERLEALAAREDASGFDVRDDVARGRARLLRNRVGVAGAAVLAGAVVLGTGLALGGGGTGHAAPGPGPADGGPTATATYHAPLVTLSPSAPPPTPTTPEPDARDAWLRTQLDRPWSGPQDIPFKAWRNDLFRTARSVLDPSGTHLTYSSAGLNSGSDQHGVGLGIKLGWAEPGAAGQGMVQVEVTSEGGSDQERCALTGEFGCPRTVHAGGATLKVGNGDGGAFIVLYRQPDGERSVVLVDPLFGNNSRTPVRAGFVSRQDVYRLVRDDRLDLPQPPSS